MRRARFLFALMCLLALSALLQGCFVYSTAVDERSLSTQASDKGVVISLNAKFVQDPDVKYFHVTPYCYEGHAYLIGETDSEKEKERAKAIAKAEDGVREVTTYFVSTADDGCGTTRDLEIHARLSKRLIAEGDLHSTNVDLEVLHCRVVLLGLVGSQKEADLAESIASHTPFVREVVNFLYVR
jgi:hyperosmotically inducible periplasmic protein